MILDIVADNHFSQRKLFLNTNRFFNNSKRSKMITNMDSNYAIHINKGSIKIIMSDNHTCDDIEKIKSYIETTFKNHSIFISSTRKEKWFNEIKDVCVHVI